MDIQEKPEIWCEPIAIFQDEDELRHFNTIGPAVRQIFRMVFVSMFSSPIEFPYKMRVTHDQLNKVLGTATMLILIGQADSPYRQMDESFVREITDYYSRLGLENLSAEETDTPD